MRLLGGLLLGGQLLLETTTPLGNVDNPDEGDYGHADRPEHGRNVGKVHVHKHRQVLPVGLQQRPVQLLHVLQSNARGFALE